MAGAHPVASSLGSPEDWFLLGEGNANVVYGYAGWEPHLVGKVLKVRKSPGGSRCKEAGADQELERAVWGPVLGQEHKSPLARELLYAQRCLAPLLGVDHVPEQVPVDVPWEFLRQLPNGPSPAGGAGKGEREGGRWSLDISSPSVVLMPDVSRFVAAPSGPCPPPAIPGEPSAATEAPARAGVGSGPASSACGGLAQRGSCCWACAHPEREQSLCRGAAPTLCVEIKPKCGFLATCETVHPDNRIKHNRSRYQLHQLLKVAEGKVASPSTYEPLDLFSGAPDRMLRALRALFDHPQNNLKLFLDGRPLTAAREGLREWVCAGEGSCGGGCKSSSVSPQGSAAGAGGSFGSAEEELEHLLSLLLQVLVVEGVLEALLEAQWQCPYDIEGIYALYCQLQASAGAAGVACAAADSLRPLLGTPEQLADVGSGGSDCEALRQLLSLPAWEAFSVLRKYVVATTAKDCAVMITLQRLASAAEAAQLRQQGHKVLRHPGAGGPSGGCSPASGLDAAGPQTQEEDGGAAGGGTPAEKEGGGWYRYRVAYVDLDMKPLARIPHHHALDQRILQAARLQHPLQGNGNGYA